MLILLVFMVWLVKVMLIILLLFVFRLFFVLNFFLILVIFLGFYCVFNNKYLYLFILRFGWYIIEILLIEWGLYGFRNDVGWRL